VINGDPDSPMAERASAFSARLNDRFDIHILHRVGGTVRAIARLLQQIASVRPDACYVLDLAAAGVLAAGLYRHATGVPFILDTGDDVVALGRALGRGPLGMLATRLLEAYALRASRDIVVRGSYHREMLRERSRASTFVPDGVAIHDFDHNTPSPELAATPSSRKFLTIGLVGSSVWIPSRQTCYGWELVELIPLLRRRMPDLNFRAILIGDGSGIAHLQQRCRKYGIEERVEFAGRVPYAELPARLQEFDICLSTQTDDAIGRVRTTGKLPLYLAAGRFVLASRVGEAARILPQEMLVEFRGSVDPDYPARLADRIVTLLSQGIDFAYRPDGVALARVHFDYDILAPRIAAVLSSLWIPVSTAGP
jgi:glycosyltransferase involved in cell wall biosynthesis